MESGLQRNGVWIASSSWLRPKTARRFTRRYLELGGRFNAHEHGYGAYAGTLEDVRWLEEVMSDHDFQRQRVGWSHDAVMGAIRQLLVFAALATLAAIIGLGLWRILRRLPG